MYKKHKKITKKKCIILCLSLGQCFWKAKIWCMCIKFIYSAALFYSSKSALHKKLVSESNVSLKKPQNWFHISVKKQPVDSESLIRMNQVYIHICRFVSDGIITVDNLVWFASLQWNIPLIFHVVSLEKKMLVRGRWNLWPVKSHSIGSVKLVCAICILTFKSKYYEYAHLCIVWHFEFRDLLSSPFMMNILCDQ